MKRTGKKQNTDKLWFFFLPSLLGVSIFVLIPFTDVIRRSFFTAVTNEFTGFTNYRVIFENQAFQLAVKNTIRFTAICLPLLITLSFLVAAILSRLRQVQIIKSIYLFPLAVPTATVVLIWKMFFLKQGIINGFLQHIGIPAVDFMGTGAAFWVLVFSYVWKNLGYTVILWLSGILSISDSLIDAAKVDGASDWQCMIRVILPNLKPTLYTIMILSFLNSFKVFREAYLVAGSYPHESMYLLQHLFNNWFANLDLDKMAAAAVLIAIVLLFSVLLLQSLSEDYHK